MPVDPTIISAMKSAVDGDPDNLALRLHLASLLLESEQPQDALMHCAFVLAKQPAHLEALQKAMQAAEASGDKERATGYRSLYEALSWNQTKNMLDDIEDRPLPESSRPTQKYADNSTLSGSFDTSSDRNPNKKNEDSHQDNDPFLLREGSDDSDTRGVWEAEEPDMTLADVAGMEEVKKRLNIAFLAPMKNPDMRKLYGKSLRGGLLLYGPPGCGKTYIARATAGEMGARFVSVGLSDVLDMYMGQSEKNLHAIFETARRHSPCVLFFDEIDALGRKRSLVRESFGRTVVNQLLNEMDSVAANNEGVFVLAATNHPWDVDMALRRPGRLDRTLLVLPPDAPARDAIVRFNLRERPVDGVDVGWVVSKTDGFSGADVAHLCDSAAELALEDSIQRGVARPIGQRDFQAAIRDVKPTVRAWFDTARNYAQFANEGGTYDDLLKYLSANKLL